MPPKPLPSQLTPYGELIVGLKELRWTFEGICDYLREKADVDVATSTLHNFYVAYTSKPKRPPGRRRKRTILRPAKPGPSQKPMTHPKKDDPDGFVYDKDEPL